mmetsp:Transcript_4946/g.10738  ORF Transcript_4946/g.10738 Transcript_4946/m.10738 type:complete len:431 (+) Transcript_4946:224-1516(+)
MVTSSHRCMGAWSTGADIGSVDMPRDTLTQAAPERHCSFRRVCTSSTGDWVYFAKSDEFMDRKSFPAGVDIWARGGFGRHLAVQDQMFTVQHGSIPQNATFLPDAVVVKVRPFAPSNLGHFLGNSLYPAFHLAWRFLGASALLNTPRILFDGLNQTNPEQMAQRCARWGHRRSGNKGSLRDACDKHIRTVSKFVTELVPALTGKHPYWEESLRRRAQREANGLLCVKELLVGTGGLSWSALFTLAGGVQRRPPLTLWPDFVEKISRGLLPDSGTPNAPGNAMLLVKYGRRAPLLSAYNVLAQFVETRSGVQVTPLEPSQLTLKQQFRVVSRASFSITPDGGASFLCAFMPEGAALVVLGELEKWVWANDRRVRAFYCTPRGPRVACLPASPENDDCYTAEAVMPCLIDMLPRVLHHVRHTWPTVGVAQVR